MTMNPNEFLSKIYGSEDVVRIRRILYSAAEAYATNEYTQVFPSGSRAEGLEMKYSDYDLMYLLTEFRVYESEMDIDPFNNKTSLVMDTNYTTLGFTRLKLADKLSMSDETANWFINCLVQEGHIYVSSSLIREPNRIGNFTTHGPCMMIKYKDIEVEHLLCFRCKEWISIVQPWVWRIRGPWPSNELIDTITQFGVLFVPVGCKTSIHEDIEWRISFSSAEKQLIHSFNHTQFLGYALLKTILSDVIKPLHGDLLCSYFIKTVMFWVLEEQKTNSKAELDVSEWYKACFTRLIYCVQSRICLHYFIPEINFFEDRFTDEEQTGLLSTLHDIFSSGWNALHHTSTFLNFKTRYRIDLSLRSSIVAPFVMTSFNSFFYENIYYKTFRHVCITKPKTRNIMSYVLSLLSRNCSNQMLDINCGNKQLYHQYKSHLADILIGSSDCVTGWCLLASLFYKLELYDRCKFIVNDCLQKCTPEKVYLDANTHISIPSYIQDLLSDERFFTKTLRHLFIDIVHFQSKSLLPIELISTLVDDIDEQRTIRIPSVVYLLFLDFLCEHHLGHDRAKENAFKNLQTTVNERYFIMNDYQLKYAEQILNVASHMKEIV